MMHCPLDWSSRRHASHGPLGIFWCSTYARRRRQRVTNNIGGEFHQLDLNLYPNEASGLLTVENDALLDAHGWEFALWAVLDEGRIEDCVAIIGHRRGADMNEGWEIERLHAI